MRHDLWRYAGWSSFLLLCGIVAYGLTTSGIFSQRIWTPDGIYRFLGFLIIYWALAALVMLTTRDLLTLIVGGVAVILSIATSGWVPVVSVLFYALSAVVLGATLLQTFAGWFGRCDEIPLAFVIGLSVSVLVLAVTAHLPVHFPGVYFVALLIPLLARTRLTLHCVRLILLSVVQKRSMPVTLLLAANLCLALAHWIVTLKPEVSADGLAMHLVIPTTVASWRRWHFDVDRFSWAVMPMAGDWCYTISYLLGGEQAARLMNALSLFAVTALIGYIARQSVSPVAALIITGAFLATPIVQLVTGSLFIENFLSATLIGALAAGALLYRTGNSGYAWFAATLCGTAVATKFGAFAAAIPILLAVVLRLTSGVSRLFCIAIFFLVGCPPYLTAWLRTGNPLFPFLNDIFRSPYFEIAALTDTRFASSIGWTTLYDLVFRTSRFLESQNGAFGFHYMLLLPLALLFFPSGKWAWHSKVGLMSSAAAFAAILSAQANARYVYPALPLALIAVAAAWQTVQDRSPDMYRALLTATGVLAIISIGFLPSSGWYHKEFLIAPFDASKLQAYVDEHAPGRSLVRYFNTKYPNEPVLFFVNGQSAGLHGRVYLHSWHNYTFERLLSQARNVADVARVVKTAQIRSVVAPSTRRANELDVPMLHDFIRACVIPEYEVNGYIAGRISAAGGTCGGPLPGTDVTIR